MEIGYNQKVQVLKILHKLKYNQCRVMNDYARHPRVAIAQLNIKAD